MRIRWLLVIAFFSGLNLAQAQLVGRLFYDEHWRLTRKDVAVYFRVVVIDTANQVFVGPVKDFTKDGKLIMTGTYVSGKQQGQFVGYRKSGQKEWEGSYLEGERSGPWQFFHPNGTLRTEIEFEAYDVRLLRHIDSTGNVLFENGTGRWIEMYFESPSHVITVDASFKNGHADGIWTWTSEDGTVLCSTVMAMGQFTSGYIVADGKHLLIDQSLPLDFPDHYKHQFTEEFVMADSMVSKDYPFVKPLGRQKDLVYTIVEVSAHPIGGISAFYKVIGNLMHYPEEAKRKKIEGRVFVEFIIEKDGSLTGVKVIKGVSPTLDEEAVRALTESQKHMRWISGIQRGKRVRQKYTLPMIFKLGR